MSTDKLITRIQALLNKTTENGCTQAEMEAAVNLANKLLLMHNLDMNDVHSNNTNSTFVYTEENCVVYGQKKEEGSWERTLMTIIADFNMCDSVAIHIDGVTNKGKIVVIGKQQNVDIVLYLFDAVRQQFRFASKAAYNNHRREVLDYYNREYSELELQKDKKLSYRMPYIRSFLKGTVSGLNVKLKKQREEMLNDDMIGSRFDVMCIENAVALKDFVDKHFDNLSNTTNCKRISDYGAFEQGTKVGESAQLSKAVNTTESIQATLLN